MLQSGFCRARARGEIHSPGKTCYSQDQQALYNICEVIAGITGDNDLNNIFADRTLFARPVEA